MPLCPCHRHEEHKDNAHAEDASPPKARIRGTRSDNYFGLIAHFGRRGSPSAGLHSYTHAMSAAVSFPKTGFAQKARPPQPFDAAKSHSTSVAVRIIPVQNDTFRRRSSKERG